MAGKVKAAKLDTRKARAKLARHDRKTHWHPLIPGKPVHLGYQRGQDDRAGRWILRRYVSNRYSNVLIGLADDAEQADGVRIFDFPQAHAEALARIDAPKAEQGRLTVRAALDDYISHKRNLGEPTRDIELRARARILPKLGDLPVSELTKDVLQAWLGQLGAARAMVRSPAGRQNYRQPAADDEAVRRRRATANRTLTILKAALNRAWRDGKVVSDKAWRSVQPFKSTDAARIRYLTVAEGQRLLNASAPEFRPLVQAALQTGARYGELCRLETADFNPDAGTVAIRKSKTGRPRHVVLTDEGIAFLIEVTASRTGGDLIFKRQDGGAWLKSHQARPMREACGRAKIKPAITFHALRHTWASLSVMNGVPLMVVAKNLGHVDTRMVEKHYGHLAPSFIVDAIRAGAPRFGFKPGKVTPLVPKGAR